MLIRRLRRTAGDFVRRHGLRQSWPFRMYDLARVQIVERRLAGPKDGRMHPSAKAERTMQLVGPRRPKSFEPVAGRIAYVLHNSLPYSSGGYATRAQGLAQALRRAGADVVAVTRPGFPVDTKRELSQRTLPLEDIVDGMRYLRLFEPARSEISGDIYAGEAADAVERALRDLRPELVMAASNHVAAIPALVAARRLGLPFVYEVRGFWEVTRLSRQPSFAKWQSYRDLVLLETEVCRQADWVFTLTGAMRDELEGRGVAPATISLLPNACDIDSFAATPRNQSLAQSLGIEPNVPVIGYVGTFVDYEGLDDLAKACALLRGKGLDFHLLLVGNENTSGTDTGPITEEIRRIARSAGLSDRLVMPGRVPHAQVKDYYSLIDIAPFPRKPWPVCEMVSPMKPLEAMAMEKAVVASSVSALAEMVEDGRTGLVYEKGNERALADALERLVANAGLRREIGGNARAWVAQNRTWRHVAATALEVLKREGLLRGG